MPLGKGYIVVKTGPDIKKMSIGKDKPSRPQVKERMGVGGTKARMRHKGRVDPKAAEAHDPGETPLASAEVHYPSNDPKVKRGYVVGEAWPVKPVHGGRGGFSNYRVAHNAGGVQDAATQAQDAEGSY